MVAETFEQLRRIAHSQYALFVHGSTEGMAVEQADVQATRVGTKLVEVRARGESGLVPWDGSTLGELEVRGPWVAAAYYHGEPADDRITSDGWFKTGDIVRIEPSGCIELAMTCTVSF